MQAKLNREVIAEMYQSFLGTDCGPAISAFDCNSVWEEPPGNLRSGVFRGVKEIAQHFKDCLGMTDGTFGNDIIEILGGDRFVVVIERSLAMRNGSLMNMLVNTVFEMADGIVCNARVLPYDPEGWNSFWS